ncbi:hypothetical protein D3C75_1139440 [compost metagenome]
MEELWDDTAFSCEIFPDRQGELNIIVTTDMTMQPAEAAGIGSLRRRCEELIKRLSGEYGWTAQR